MTATTAQQNTQTAAAGKGTKARNYHLPFAPDPQQIEHMREVFSQGNHAIASQGTDRYKVFNLLVNAGYMRKEFCPKSLRVYQFSVSLHGVKIIEEPEK